MTPVSRPNDRVPTCPEGFEELPFTGQFSAEQFARIRKGFRARVMVTVGLVEVSSDPQPTPRSGCTASKLRFGRLEEELPGDREALNRFLTERFFNSQESALICPQATWQERSGEFREAILARAGVEGIPADGLEKGLAQTDRVVWVLEVMDLVERDWAWQDREFAGPPRDRQRWTVVQFEL